MLISIIGMFGCFCVIRCSISVDCVLKLDDSISGLGMLCSV